MATACIISPSSSFSAASTILASTSASNEPSRVAFPSFPEKGLSDRRDIAHTLLDLPNWQAQKMARHADWSGHTDWCGHTIRLLREGEHSPEHDVWNRA
mmetsp:Transcript_109408/g.193863  ORF Transcript_109408/g.193863 Transcript_109408/m.193863 type:complete len:99 (+) Transcript_109408:1728-2024(+)